ncbi:unnamed protein product [Auanema sp. JU1783]|nr:unnamed protein product [Auanema sp. JU1783]
MVYDASLGYDPEEWEECPEPEHFLVFSFFTRFFLSAMAVGFAYVFFKLVEENKNKGNKKDEEEAPVTGELLQEVGQKLEKILVEQQDQPDFQQKYQILNAQQQRRIERNEQQNLSQTTYNNLYEPPSSAEQLIREAEEYLRESPKKEASPRPFQYLPDTLEDTQPSAPRQFEQTLGNAPSQVHQAAQGQAQIIDDAFDSLINERPAEPATHYQQPLPALSPLDEQFMNLEQQAQQDRQPQQFSPQSKPEKKLSSEQQQAIYEWEMERERLENERIANLNQDRVVGGEESEFDNSEQAIDRLLPASHISYHSRSPDEDLLREKRETLAQQNLLLQQQQQQLENARFGDKLQQKINLLAGQADSAPNRDSYRDSELTDYDISDFHVHEPHYDHAASPTEDVQFVQAGSIQKEQRHETGDSDEYVKVQMEPIYDVPPGNEKVMSNEEARQLQELCREYDFGMDLGMPTTKQSSNERLEPSTSAEAAQAYVQEVQASPFGVIGDRPVPQPRFTSAVIPSEKLNDQGTTIRIRLDGTNEIPQDDTRNIVAAEMYIQDALEYLGNQNVPNAASGFVMEEDMLSSPHDSKRISLNLQMKPTSGDPTSQMVKTMEVFERVEQDEHDDMTYAPEIQSVEIPPDQMSENSDNLQEYFDRVAAEGGIPPEIMKPLQSAHQVIQQNAVPQAPQILSAFANRKTPSNSSLASGRSGRSHSGMSSDGYPRLRKQSSLLSVLGVTSMQEMLLTITSLDALSDAMRKAGLESTNLIFGIDYTASNKYQGEESFGGRSLHTIHPNIKNPYQQVITILGNTLAPFASTGRIPLFGFGDAKTGDWSTFSLKPKGDCTSLEEVLKVYNEITPSVELSGPTNFAPLIYQAMEICQKANDYHILVIIADGQVTNERATRRAIVQACQYPLSIIVVGVGDGPWDMMRVFDESLPKRSWDNFHFVEYHDIMKKTAGLEDGELKLAVQSLLEIPDQYRCICELGLLRNRPPPMRGSDIRKEMQTQ